MATQSHSPHPSPVHQHSQGGHTLPHRQRRYCPHQHPQRGFHRPGSQKCPAGPSPPASGNQDTKAHQPRQESQTQGHGEQSSTRHRRPPRQANGHRKGPNQQAGPAGSLPVPSPPLSREEGLHLRPEGFQKPRNMQGRHRIENGLVTDVISQRPALLHHLPECSGAIQKGQKIPGPQHKPGIATLRRQPDGQSTSTHVPPDHSLPKTWAGSVQQRARRICLLRHVILHLPRKWYVETPVTATETTVRPRNPARPSALGQKSTGRWLPGQHRRAVYSRIPGDGPDLPEDPEPI